MKRISYLIKKKENSSRVRLDDKTTFYLFKRIIKQEYGNQGAKNLEATFFKNGKLFVAAESSVWAAELLLNKNEIIRKINKEIGRDEIYEIKIN
jgi:predicted nucleic acid-binding Zn ribbon protein